MRFKYIYTLSLLVLLATAEVQAQGTFQNLNFESANVPPSGPQPYGTFVPIGSALPGWTAYLGDGQITQVGYNSPTLSTATVSLIGPTWNSSDVSLSGVGIIDGNYSVAVESGAVPTNTVLQESASIAQNGTVPLTAESLQFKASGFGFAVTFAGNALSLLVLSSGESADGLPYNLYGANISAWAGQTGELEFTTGSGMSTPTFELDDIMFSPTPLPEPNPLALTGVGGLLFALYRRVSPKPAKSGRSAKNLR
jgi:hypothetical protein